MFYVKFIHSKWENLLVHLKLKYKHISKHIKDTISNETRNQNLTDICVRVTFKMKNRAIYKISPQSRMELVTPCPQNTISKNLLKILHIKCPIIWFLPIFRVQTFFCGHSAQDIKEYNQIGKRKNCHQKVQTSCLEYC